MMLVYCAKGCGLLLVAEFVTSVRTRKLGQPDSEAYPDLTKRGLSCNPKRDVYKTSSQSCIFIAMLVVQTDRVDIANTKDGHSEEKSERPKATIITA